MKILFLLPYQMVPPDKGNKHLIFNLLIYVTKHADCDLVVLIDSHIDHKTVDAVIRAVLPNVQNIFVYHKSSGIRCFLLRLQALACGYPPTLGRYWNKSLANWLKIAGNIQRYDVIHFDMFHMAQYRRYCDARVSTVLVPSDAYSLSAKYVRKASLDLVVKMRMTIMYMLMSNYERNKYRQFDTVCPVASVDTDYLKRITSKATNFKTVGVSIGEDFVQKKPRSWADEDRNINCGILYAGPISQPGVAAGVLEFLTQTLPRISALLPDTYLTVLGHNPHPVLRKHFELNDKIEHIEYVQDYIEFLNRDWVYVHPQQTNAGYQTKVQQAMAVGLPVVGYELAFTGMGGKNGEHCFICRSEKEFAENVLRLLTDEDLRSKIGFAAASHIREKYSIEKVGGEYMECYREVISRNSFTEGWL